MFEPECSIEPRNPRTPYELGENLRLLSWRGLPGYEALQWAGLLAPAGTARELIARLHKESVATLSRPELVENVVRDGSVVVASTPEAFTTFIKAEVAKWAGVVKAAGILPE